MAGVIVIPPDIYNQWMFYVRECPGEVSAMGRIQRLGADFLVTKIYLLPQEVGAAHTDIDAEAICKLMLETMDDPGDLLYWVHSHANMGAFWSGVDLETIRTMGKNGLCVASVFNKKGESKHAICYKTLVEYTGEIDVVLYENVEHVIGNPVTREQEASWRAELKEKVRERKYTYTPYISHGNTALTATKDAESDPYDENDPYDESIVGILGYGVAVEAQAVGMTVKEYREILEKGKDHEDYIGLEALLEQAWREGRLRD